MSSVINTIQRFTSSFTLLNSALLLLATSITTPALIPTVVQASAPTAVCESTANINFGFPAAPILLTPSNNATDTNGFDFSWSSVANAVQYDWESSLSSDTTAEGSFSSQLGYHRLDTTSINEGNSPANTYYWHVRAIGSDGASGAWSQTWKVTIDKSSSSYLSAPVLTAPANGATCNIYSEDFYFTWNAPGNTGSFSPLTYIFQSGLSPNTNPVTGDFVDQPWTVNGITNTSIFDGNSPSNTYYWHIRAVGSNGTLGPWSATWVVTITHDAPPVVETPDPVEPTVPVEPETPSTSTPEVTPVSTTPISNPAPVAQVAVITVPQLFTAPFSATTESQNSVLGTDTTKSTGNISATKTDHANFASTTKAIQGNWFARYGIYVIALILALSIAALVLRRRTTDE